MVGESADRGRKLVTMTTRWMVGVVTIGCSAHLATTS